MDGIVKKVSAALAVAALALCAAATPALASDAQSMLRVCNPNSGEHFYTASAAEKDKLVSVGWRYEGVGWYAPASSQTPVYRLYSGTDHHYTTSLAEKHGVFSKRAWNLRRDMPTIR